jgi:hypothetical protein
MIVNSAISDDSKLRAFRDYKGTSVGDAWRHGLNPEYWRHCITISQGLGWSVSEADATRRLNYIRVRLLKAMFGNNFRRKSAEIILIVSSCLLRNSIMLRLKNCERVTSCCAHNESTAASIVLGSRKPVVGSDIFNVILLAINSHAMILVRRRHTYLLSNIFVMPPSVLFIVLRCSTVPRL